MTPNDPTEQELQAAVARMKKQKEQRKTYAAKRKEAIKTNPELAEKQKAAHKRYQETHKDKLAEGRKAYYEKNKDKMKAHHKAYNEKQKALREAIKAKAASLGMSVDEYIEAS